MPEVLVTTSWDDGHALDTKLADVLHACGCQGTFYIAPLSHEIPVQDRLSPAALRDLSTAFEVGSHTLTHPKLTQLAPSQAEREITEGKRAVEDIIGGPVTSFCYPYGAYDPHHVDMVRRAGFSVGRTTRRFSVERSVDPLQMATTSHAARYKADGGRVVRLTTSPSEFVRTWRNWDVLARRLAGPVLVHGGVIHLWGHSWEIERNGDWSRLSSFLRELASHDNVTMVRNSALGERT
jgi:peptidoglycan/xylan/chitin deacetylase (PgdA/CDA1 family)